MTDTELVPEDIQDVDELIVRTADRHSQKGGNGKYSGHFFYDSYATKRIRKALSRRQIPLGFEDREMSTGLKTITWDGTSITILISGGQRGCGKSVVGSLIGLDFLCGRMGLSGVLVDPKWEIWSHRKPQAGFQDIFHKLQLKPIAHNMARVTPACCADMDLGEANGLVHQYDSSALSLFDLETMMGFSSQATNILPAKARLQFATCVHPDESVFKSVNGNINLTSLCDLREGDFIIGDGQLCKIKKIFKKRTDENMIEITARGGRKIRVTENHLIPTKQGLLFAKNLKRGDELRINYNIVEDEIKEINIIQELDKQHIKYRLDNDKIVIERLKTRIPARIKITPAFARLCGYYTSEGDVKGFTLNVKETNKHEELIRDFKEVFGLNLVKYIRGNGISLYTGHKFLMNLIFVQIMGLGRGAKNKGVGKVWGFSEKNIIEYVRGCLNGDGCLCRHGKGTANETIHINLKTASKRLKEEFRFLLEYKLGIFCSTYKGINKKRYIGEREISPSTYYSLNIFGKDNIEKIVSRLELMNNYKEFMEIFERVGNKKYSSNRLSHNKAIITNIKIIEKPKHVIDIMVDENNLFTINGNIIVHNCGIEARQQNLTWQQVRDKKAPPLEEFRRRLEDFSSGENDVLLRSFDNLLASGAIGTQGAVDIIDLINKGKLVIYQTSLDADLSPILSAYIAKELRDIIRERITATKVPEKSRLKSPIMVYADEFNTILPRSSNPSSADPVKRIYGQMRFCGVSLIGIAPSFASINPVAIQQSDYIISGRLMSDEDVKAMSVRGLSMKQRQDLKKLEINKRETPPAQLALIDADGNIEKFYPIPSLSNFQEETKFQFR